MTIDMPTGALSRRALVRGAAVLAGGVALAGVASGTAEARGRHRHRRPAPSPTPTATPAAPPRSAQGASTGQYSITNSPDLSAARSMGLVVLLPHEWGRIAAIKAANPATKVFVYKNVGAVSRHGTGDYQPNIVTYQQVRSNPDWALHDNRGNVIYWTDFGGYLQPIDPGNPAVIAESVRALTAECKQHGFDGVYFDDVNTDWSHTNTGSSYPVDFTGGNAYASTRAWVEGAVPKLKAAGIETIANAQVNADTWKDVLSIWASNFDGVALEHFMRWGDYTSPEWSNFTGWDWEQRLGQTRLITSKGAYIVGVSWGDRSDVLGQRYARANFLLLGDGRGYSLWTPTNLQGSFDCPSAMVDLGAPTGQATKLDNGVWKRTFERGYVLVNPTKSYQTVQLSDAGLGSGTRGVASGDAHYQGW